MRLQLRSRKEPGKSFCFAGGGAPPQWWLKHDDPNLDLPGAAEAREKVYAGGQAPSNADIFGGEGKTYEDGGSALYPEIQAYMKTAPFQGALQTVQQTDAGTEAKPFLQSDPFKAFMAIVGAGGGFGSPGVGETGAGASAGGADVVGSDWSAGLSGTGNSGFVGSSAGGLDAFGDSAGMAGGFDGGSGAGGFSSTGGLDAFGNSPGIAGGFEAGTAVGSGAAAGGDTVGSDWSAGEPGSNTNAQMPGNGITFDDLMNSYRIASGASQLSKGNPLGALSLSSGVGGFSDGMSFGSGAAGGMGGGSEGGFGYDDAASGQDYGNDDEWSNSVTDPKTREALGLPNTPGLPGPGSGAASKSDISSMFDKAMKYGPLALGAAGMLQQNSASKKAVGKYGELGGTQRGVANEMIQQAQAGQINPADQYSIDQWQQQAIAQAQQYYSKAGLSDSSMANGAINEIKAKATAMKEQARQQLLQTGITALNTVDKYSAAAIQAEMAGDQAAAAQATNFLSSYGNWLRALPTLTGQQPTKQTENTV